MTRKRVFMAAALALSLLGSGALGWHARRLPPGACPRCRGDGTIEFRAFKPCHACDGTGIRNGPDK
jgi:hypothetical protein